MLNLSFYIINNGKKTQKLQIILYQLYNINSSHHIYWTYNNKLNSESTKPHFFIHFLILTRHDAFPLTNTSFSISPVFWHFKQHEMYSMINSLILWQSTSFHAFVVYSIELSQSTHWSSCEKIEPIIFFSWQPLLTKFYERKEGEEQEK